ncbi:hypothetical protein FCULG_00011445 [Fusarium culmorum]|uniref:Uncharacterized protein n=1 Tax=Fusarium culmorum TaxID=5516 RepID=A0A2T4H5A4_FUSCU|nr:hypothetical protein FCULG_00011445 [Fusarium culmorum]
MAFSCENPFRLLVLTVAIGQSSKEAYAVDHLTARIDREGEAPNLDIANVHNVDSRVSRDHIDKLEPANVPMKLLDLIFYACELLPCLASNHRGRSSSG